MIVLAANPEWPKDVRPVDYDRARRASEWPASLTAKSLQRRWNMSWSQILDMLFDSERDPGRTIAARTRKVRRVGQFTLEEIVEALRLVAGRVGAEGFTAAEYDAEIRRMRRGGAAAWLHGRPQELPLSADIDVFLREDGRSGWAIAMEAAGFEVARGAGAPKGETWEQAVAMFVDEVGVLPWSPQAVQKFMAQKNLSLAAKKPGEIQRAREAAALRWQAEGRGSPLPAPPRGERPKIDVQRAESAEGRRRRRELADETRETVVASIVAALRVAHSRGIKFGQTPHRALAKEFPSEILHPSAVDRWAKKYSKPSTTAKALRTEAERRFASARPPARR